MKTRHIILVSATALSVLAACTKEYLKPNPLSIYTPESTYVSYDALLSAVAAASHNLDEIFYGYGTPMGYEMALSDVAVNGTTDNGTTTRDYDAQLTPTTMGTNFWANCYGTYWSNNYNGIKYANIILNRISNATFDNESKENEIRGFGYFFRAYHYLKLVCQFGDVPWIGSEIETPKTDFYTYDKWSILEQIEKDAEYAYQWIGDVQDIGYPTKGAAGLLYMKILMLNGKFDKAIQVGNEVVSAHPLMTVNDSDYANLQLYLHSREGKVAASNKGEALFCTANWPQVAGSQKSYKMRNFTPFWAKLRTPEGKTGCTNGGDPELRDTEYDNNLLVGRGIGTYRPTNYYQYDIWTSKEALDERGPGNRDSWRSPTDLYYNTKAAGSYYKKHIEKVPIAAAGDSLRWWFNWPHYKTYVPDEYPANRQDIYGGETPWYIMRSAEVYLLMAECYYWKGGSDQQLVDMLNVVRRRAGAEDLTASEAGMAAILNERARELYMEEERHAELVRISLIYGKTGKPCEVYGTTYSLNNFSGPDVVGQFCKDKGVNFFFDWVNDHNNFYNNGTFYGPRQYTLSTHHVFLPIPEAAITSNTNGVINQNDGYVKLQENITPLKIGEEGNN